MTGPGAGRETHDDERTLPPRRARTVGYARAVDDEESRAASRLLERHRCAPIHLDVAPAVVRPALPALTRCLGTLRGGDVVVVPGLEHLAGSLTQLLTLLADLDARGVDVVVLDHGIDTRTAGGRALYETLPYFSSFSRKCLRRSTRQGLRSAQANGRRVGRPPVMDADRIALARTMLARPEHSIASVARALAVSRSTLYKYLPEIGDDVD